MVLLPTNKDDLNCHSSCWPYKMNCTTAKKKGIENKLVWLEVKTQTRTRHLSRVMPQRGTKKHYKDRIEILGKQTYRVNGEKVTLEGINSKSEKIHGEK